MSSHMSYAQLRHRTWVYRRTFPRDVQPLLGTALKRSLQTGDVREARTRVAHLNATFEEMVTEARSRMASGYYGELAEDGHTLRLPVALPQFQRRVRLIGQDPVVDLVNRFLEDRSKVLRPETFQAVRYGLGLFVSVYGQQAIGSLSLAEGRAYLKLLATLPRQGDANAHGKRLSGTTQARLWGVVRQFLSWAVIESYLARDPFEGLPAPRIAHASYVVMDDAEVVSLLEGGHPLLRPLLLLCLLSGLRSGEATGLTAEDVVSKGGNLGAFVSVRQNTLRSLKSQAAEREVPLHRLLERHLLPTLPTSGPLFPDLSVDRVVKLFARDRTRLGLKRPGLVFHSTRKWFTTQCERAGVPEHFTASLVGHQSARSANRLTYGLYSAGISDTQKREIIDQIRLPEGIGL
jgi:integrase